MAHHKEDKHNAIIYGETISEWQAETQHKQASTKRLAFHKSVQPSNIDLSHNYYKYTGWDRLRRAEFESTANVGHRMQLRPKTGWQANGNVFKTAC